MSYAPKTPARHQRSRSEAKTPLTPSLITGLNSFSLATPAKSRGDTTNPFISSSKHMSSSRPVGRPVSSGRPKSCSRPSSPAKRPSSGGINVTHTLQRQASAGVIRKGGIESRMDVVTRDYVPPPKPEVRRSKSQPSVSLVKPSPRRSSRRLQAGYP